jgi:beta-fructofuranosidase
MALRLPDRWLWDFWFAREGDDVHVFYLQAPRSLGRPELRHWNATIGHSVTRDLRTWEVLEDALGAGPPGAFDDLATWTGSIVRQGGRWHLLYTGVSRADAPLQRVGRAVSDDLVGWERHGVVVESDPRWYERVHWRDPWVQPDPDGGGFHMFLTARANVGTFDGRGVIAHAVSADLGTWVVQPPVTEPGEFFELEVPQLVHLAGAWRLFFCTTGVHHSAARRARGVMPETGTHYMTARRMLGPYALDRDGFLMGHPEGRHYAGRVIEHGGQWWFLAWHMQEPRGGFAGILSDPMPIIAGDDGSLAVLEPR